MAYSGKGPHGEDPTGRHDQGGRGPDFERDEAQSNASAHAYASRGVDAWTFVDILSRRWHWIFLSGCLVAAAGVFLGLRMWKPSFSVTGQLIRVENEHLTEFFKPQQFTDLTFGNLLRAPELMARVGAQHAPPLSANEVANLLEVVAVPESEIITVTAHGSDAGAVVRLANLYSTNAVRYTQELQSREATQVKEAIKEQLAANDADINRLHQELKSVPKNDAFQPNQRLAELYTRLQVARTDLQVLKRTYKDVYPPVQQKQAEIEELEKQIQEVASQPNLPPTGRRELMPMPLPQAGVTNTPTMRTNNNGTRSFARVTTDAYDPSHDFLQNQLFALSSVQMTLAARQRDAETFITKPPGYIRELAPALTHNVYVNDPKKKIGFLGLLGFVVGVCAALALVMLIELVDDRIRTVDDVRRVTKLPVLATLGDLRRIPADAQAHWAFRTWTALQSRLSLSANHGLVCGIISSAPKEGRTTWVELLAQAASQCGFKVLTVATLHGPEHNGNGKHSQNGDHKDTDENESPEQHTETEGSDPTNSEHQPWHMPAGNATDPDGDPNNPMAITTSILSYPAQVTQQLTGKNAQPMVHIPLPGWVWNLERRKQWQTAMTHWSRIDNIVILVELPPSNSPEAVLLAQNLPNLIYLADGGRTSAADCRDQLQTLRNARCNLVGSVLNREKRAPMKRRFSRWVGCWGTLALLPWMVLTATAQTPDTISGGQQTQVTPEQTAPEQGAPGDGQQTEAGEAAPPRRVGSFSVTAPGQRAAWQQKLTLGPGDVLNFALFGQPDFSRTEVMVGPDGRISYLHAVDVPATGLTIDELRVTLDQALDKAGYLRSPRTIVTPVQWKSKRYYMLGKVVNKGAYVLDRPITILESVARAGGLETGLLDINSVDLADLKRSFLVRQGKRADVNFEKLFLEGDLSQNIPIEPDDYLYFAAGNLKEVYLVGEVNSPGPVLYTPNTTLIGAITHRAGFTDRAYKSHVLVVRGSLDHPLTFVVDVWKGLEARGLNFKLEPKDIIYVSHRPFIRAEELLDLALTGFIQAAVTAWTGEHIGPLITRPLIK